MSFLEDKNQSMNTLDLKKTDGVEFEKATNDSQANFNKPVEKTNSSPISNLDAELKSAKAQPEKNFSSAIDSPTIDVPAMSLPKVKPGLGVIGGSPKPSPGHLTKDVPLSKLPASGDGLDSSFSLLPVDEESILYVDFPAALRRILYAFVISGFILFGAWFAANYYLNKYFVKANDLQQQIRSLSLEKLKYQTTDVDVRLRYQFYKTLQQLLSNHITWQHFFAMLEKYTAPEVHFTNFSVNIMNDLNQIMFTAYASDLKSALKQYMVLKNYASDFCENVSISGLTLLKTGEEEKDGGVSFNLNFAVKAELFNVGIINSLKKN